MRILVGTEKKQLLKHDHYSGQHHMCTSPSSLTGTKRFFFPCRSLPLKDRNGCKAQERQALTFGYNLCVMIFHHCLLLCLFFQSHVFFCIMEIYIYFLRILERFPHELSILICYLHHVKVQY